MTFRRSFASALLVAAPLSIALVACGGAPVESSDIDALEAETAAEDQALMNSRPGSFSIQFGIMGYAGGCFKGPGVCSVGPSTPTLANATGLYDGNGTLWLTAKSVPADVVKAGGVTIGAPIALNTTSSISLKVPDGLALQPGFFSGKLSGLATGPMTFGIKLAPVLGTPNWATYADAVEVAAYGASVANPKNRFDWVGRLHNKAMLYGRSVLTRGAAPSAVDSTTANFLSAEGVKVDTTKFFASGVSKFTAELRASTAPAEYLVRSGKMSSRGAAYYARIVDASTKNALAGDFSTSRTLEAQIAADRSLPAQESDTLLATAAIGRYSAAFVISTGLLQGAEAMKANPIVKADISGGIGGGISGAVTGAVVVPVVGSVPGWVVGGVAGAAGASLGEWVSSWF